MDTVTYIRTLASSRGFVVVRAPGRNASAEAISRSLWSQLGDHRCCKCGHKHTRAVVVQVVGHDLKVWGRDCFATDTGLLPAKAQRVTARDVERVRSQLRKDSLRFRHSLPRVPGTADVARIAAEYGITFNLADHDHGGVKRSHLVERNVRETAAQLQGDEAAALLTVWGLS